MATPGPEQTAERPEQRQARRRMRRRVRTYSRLVTLMKIALPLAAVALIATIFLGGRDTGNLNKFFSPEELAALGAGLRLEHPRFAGVTERGEPFVIRADWALPDQALPHFVDLERPTGEIELRDGRTVSGHAATGRLHRDTKTLLLQGGVVFDSSDGIHFETDQMTFDLNAGTANSPGPVRGSGPSGTIQAGSFRAATGEGDDSQDGGQNGSGRQFWFENRVRLVFIPAMQPGGTGKPAGE